MESTKNYLNNQNICPVEKAGGLDNSFRKILQNPKKILKPYLHDGMTVLDLGCGPGFFTIEMAKLVFNSGKVIAADLQEGMLDIVRRKILGTKLEPIIRLHQCKKDRIGINEKVDFILAFYMIHEVKNQEELFKELKSILNPGGKLLIVEPKFHVSKNSFDLMINKIKMVGLEITGKPKIFFSRSIVLGNK